MKENPFITGLQQWAREEALFLWLYLGICLISSIYLILNATIFHYHGVHYINSKVLRPFPWAIALLFIAYYLRRHAPRFSLFFDTAGKLYFLYLVSAFICQGTQYTPFHLIDQQLHQIDRWMGYRASAVLQFTHQHYWIEKISKIIYDALACELLFLPLLCAFLLEKKSLRIFYIANLIAFYIGFNLYYFFPTTDPAHVIPFVHFLSKAYSVVAQFIEIHLHLKQYITVGAMIDFPSFHVIWASLLIYLVRHRKILFYPVLGFNIMMMLSTLTLGWHFLVSAVGGLLVAIISIYIAERLTLMR